MLPRAALLVLPTLLPDGASGARLSMPHHLRLLPETLRRIPPVGLLGALLLIGTLPGLSYGQALPADPVEELKKALKLDPDPTSGISVKELDKSPAAAKLVKDREAFRERNLNDKVEKLKSLGDMSRALLLNDWVIFDLGLGKREPVSVDHKMMRKLTALFVEEGEKRLSSGDENARVAAAFVIAQTAVEGRTQEPRSWEFREAIGNKLGKVLVEQLKNPSANVRAAAAVALGLIQPPVTEPEFVAALGKALGDPEVLVRRGAARGLGEMLLTLVQLDGLLRARGKEFEGRYKVVLDQMRDGSTQALQVICKPRQGLADSDLNVRRLCATSLQILTEYLRDRINKPGEPEGIFLQPDDQFELENKGRDWREVIRSVRERGQIPAPKAKEPDLREVTPVQRDFIESLSNGVKELIKSMEKVSSAAQDNAAALAQAANDADPMVSTRVRQALENLADARQKMRTLLEVVGELMARKVIKDMKVTSDSPSGRGKALVLVSAWAEGEKPGLTEPGQTLDALRKGLSSPNARARVTAVHAFEMMGEMAAPAIPDLIKALKDTDYAVRWASARTLGKMTLNSEQVVPALIPVLSDREIAVAVAGAIALKRYGPQAGPAVEALSQALSVSDPDFRIAVLEALEAVGLKAVPALESVVGILSDDNYRVRKTAAWVLGRFGSRARSVAASRLRAMLLDENFEVRRAVSDALLHVEGD
jgi:HEAT repeat protein